MRLGDWLRKTGSSDQKLADAVGVNRSTITRIRLGTKMPSADLMERIAAATRGSVRPNDYFTAPGGAQALAAWMEAKGIDDATLAKTIGVSRPTISRLRRGGQRASEEVAARIEEASRGAVPRQSLMRMPEPGPAPQRQKAGAA